MFPAPAGINLSTLFGYQQRLRVPRASGDKPATIGDLVYALLCSPRQRG
ncbi:TPA: hypothetical protein HIT49_001354 [Escherichia coli]|nr:hypothetical protein [Escherichia coli]